MEMTTQQAQDLKRQAEARARLKAEAQIPGTRAYEYAHEVRERG
jgi:hypothetical protein